MIKNLLFIGALFITVNAAAAPKACNPTEKADVAIVKENTEDGKFLVAKVKHGNAPLKGVEVSFMSPRLFGMLSHGTAITEDDGVAKIKFPEEFPGESATGDFNVTAKIVNSERFLGETTIKVDGGLTLKEVENPFPRDIWSPNTHWYILIVIPTLILCVWSVYIFSIAQLVKISKTK